MVRGLPESYLDRAKLIGKAMEGVEKVRLKLWRERGLYAPVDFILLTPDEAEVTQPFYLDMIEDSVILLDRGGFLRRKLEELRAKLVELGARRVELADGRWYWELKPGIKKGEVLEL